MVADREANAVCAGVPEEWTGMVPTRNHFAAGAVPDDVARALTDAYVGVENGLLIECEVCERRMRAVVFHALRPDVAELIRSDLPDLASLRGSVWETATVPKPHLSLVGSVAE